MLERLLGRKPKETQPLNLSEIELPPQVDRKFYLLYLLSIAKTLTRDQIGRLAEELHADILLGRSRTLAELVIDSEILDGPKLKKVKKDPVLNKISLVYSREEMEVFIPEIITAEVLADPIQLPNNPVDWAVGSGPARPVLRDFYSLYIAYRANLKKDGTKDEIFSISPIGAELSIAIKINFASGRSLQENDVVLKVGKNSNELVWKNQQAKTPNAA